MNFIPKWRIAKLAKTGGGAVLLGLGLGAYVAKSLTVTKVYAKANILADQQPIAIQQPAGGVITAKGKLKNTACMPCPPCPPRGMCKNPCQEHQYNITSDPKCFSLFLTIHVNSSADPGCVSKVAADMRTLVCSVTDDDTEIDAGVGFGPNIWSQVYGKTCKNFYYTERKGLNGDMPATGGDIFLHAKCNDRGKLFDLCKNYICSFPEGSIREFEDIYGFDYRCGRDLSGFYDCRTNRCDENGRIEVAVECGTNGSYALVQKWVHDFCIIRDENKNALEKYIGRDMDCGNELKCKAATSHVARMTGTTEQNVYPHFEIVRASQNYGTLANDAGQVFLGFAADPAAFEFMLDQMVGAGCDSNCDDVMKISKNVKGTYYYFPSRCELAALINQSK